MDCTRSPTSIRMEGRAYAGTAACQPGRCLGLARDGLERRRLLGGAWWPSQLSFATTLLVTRPVNRTAFALFHER
eukprot:CAMPEP_0205911050 /NCGR_PEP_ID=MMETSP1325-20131115/4881_1 /ASSEMBLY_ACC=CAM_ASM_000708 /TAXON_ID=236786 /ORGANISM="Florenciella sp., Strain RCC1007" /LENGTH=74 /DNA_ID=CAMNT_0053277509 /DNA_START=123 /DNA_END=343 /DNA_ORIENTATION=+